MSGRFSIETIFKAIDRVTAPVSRMQDRVSRFTKSMQSGFRVERELIDKVTGALWEGTKVIAKYATIFAGIAATAFVAGAAALNSLADSADELSKRAKRLQFPIEALQEWQFVADQAGVSTEQFDKAIEKFSKNIGAAKMGSGPLFGALAKYDPALLRQIRHTKDASTGLELYIAHLRKVRDPTIRSAEAIAAWGKDGASMLNIIQSTTEELAALRIEARENGIVTKQQAEDAEAYGDALNSLKRAAIGLATQIVLPLLPDITEKLRQWREFLVTHKEIIRVRAVEYFDRIKQGLKDLWTWAQSVDWGALLTQFLAVLTEIHGAFEWLRDNWGWVKPLGEALFGLTVALKILAGVLTVVGLIAAANPITLWIVAITALTAGFIALVHWIDEAVQWFDKLPFVLKRLLAPLEILLRAIKFIKDAFSGGLHFAVEQFKASFNDKDNGVFAHSDTAFAPSIVTPEERAARAFSETVQTTNKAEITIRDETDRATLTRGKLGDGINLFSTGGF